MKHLVFAVVVVVCLSFDVAIADDYDTYIVDHILNVPESGLEITEWNAWYRANDTITFGDAFAAAMLDSAPNVREAGFQYDLGLKNTSEKHIIAYQLNFVVFNPWGEYLDTVGVFMGAVMKPGKGILRKNRASFNGDNQFFEFFIWIDKVKWNDGSVYVADVSNVKKEIDSALGIDFPFELLEAGNVLEVNENRRFREKQYVDVYAH